MPSKAKELLPHREVSPYELRLKQVRVLENELAAMPKATHLAKIAAP
jgi:hypothetical protein